MSALRSYIQSLSKKYSWYKLCDVKVYYSTTDKNDKNNAKDTKSDKTASANNASNLNVEEVSVLYDKSDVYDNYFNLESSTTSTPKKTPKKVYKEIYIDSLIKKKLSKVIPNESILSASIVPDEYIFRHTTKSKKLLAERELYTQELYKQYNEMAFNK